MGMVMSASNVATRNPPKQAEAAHASNTTEIVHRNRFSQFDRKVFDVFTGSCYLPAFNTSNQSPGSGVLN